MSRVHPACITAPASLASGMLQVRQGVFDKFPCEQIYGIHNWPGLNAGTVGVKGGVLMGSEDNFVITVLGKGGRVSIDRVGVSAMVRW